MHPGNAHYMKQRVHRNICILGAEVNKIIYLFYDHYLLCLLQIPESAVEMPNTQQAPYQLDVSFGNWDVANNDSGFSFGVETTNGQVSNFAPRFVFNNFTRA